MILSSRDIGEGLHISDYPHAGVPVLPEPKEEDFAWARANPGERRYFVDPRADKSALRETNVIGGWFVDDNGGIESWLNPDFVPTPQYAQRDIASELELVIWRLEYGFNNIGRFIDAFSRSELIMVLPADDALGQRGWPLRYSPSGDDRALEVYTSAGMLPKDVNPWLRRTVSGRTVLEQVCPQERMDILLNPEAERFTLVRGSQLLDWWHEWAELQRADAVPNSDGN
ncbi:hypothetical protein [Nocardia transvalensis]|uniref:hypothetical protein n=1 Tax=Nocardia transvalensis TaxID=37333 RepID=UPI0018943901|nr:hypothetical protein [Nocardia transvalensis]MBF6332789.1 hypothetical protein [Nocardia transvalensis]